MTDTIREALQRAAHAISELSSEEAALEAELLLAHALGTDRTHIYQRLPDDLPPDAAAAFDALLHRRLAHEPVTYITGRKEFRAQFAHVFKLRDGKIVKFQQYTDTALVQAALR